MRELNGKPSNEKAFHLKLKSFGGTEQVHFLKVPSL